MMANRLNDRWDAIAADPLHAVFQLFDACHQLDFYLGKDNEKHKLLLLVTPEEPPAIRDMRAIRIRSFKRDDGKWSLLLVLDSAGLSPMFSMLCEDLIESSRNTGLPADQSLGYVLRRLSNWRQLLERGLPDLLSENEVRGLCGELLTLKRLFIHVGKSDAVRAWVGPKGADQDFQTHNAAWEVKTIHPGATSVTISSESQLQTTSRTLFLVVIELAESGHNAPDSFSLNTLVEDIRTSLSDDPDSRDIFENTLISAKYVSRSEYSIPSLSERLLQLFSVHGDFPRITGNQISIGLSHVKYELSLNACEKFRLNSISLDSRRAT
jgi:hypothetical protein